MGLTIQALDPNEKVLKELEYDYVSYDNLRINLLKILNVSFQIYKYQPTMNLIVLCFDKGGLKKWISRSLYSINSTILYWSDFNKSHIKSYLELYWQ